MQDTPFQQVIGVTQLRLDTQNPRLPGIEHNQGDTVRAMVEAQQNKVIALARHIVNNGPNPASLSIVMPSEEGEGKYDVLDGNRRVAALRLLEDPSLAEGILSSKAVERLQQLSTDSALAHRGGNLLPVRHVWGGTPAHIQSPSGRTWGLRRGLLGPHMPCREQREGG